jgi:SAM-dependent methyltransferase
MSGFNRILRCFRDDLARPEYRAACERVHAVEASLRSAGLAVRRDTGRDWEYAHVLLAVDRLRRAAPVERVVDFGGGNGALAYVLAELGLSTLVLELDDACAATVRGNAAALGLCALDACAYDGRDWPMAAASASIVVAVSVYESLLRPSRQRFFAECRRVLAPGGSLLMTLDYGPDARFVGDAPASLAELLQVVAESGLALDGEPPSEPVFDPAIGPPVKVLVPTVDGFDTRVASYTFAALHLRRA